VARPKGEGTLITERSIDLPFYFLVQLPMPTTYHWIETWRERMPNSW